MLAQINPMKKTFLLLSALVSLNFSALAQPGPGGPATGMSASFMRLFGANPAFTANTEMKVSNSAQGEVSFTMKLAVRDTKMRADIDLSQIKSANIPPAIMAQMKLMGMDHVVNITRGDQKTIYIIYPGMKSYAKMTLPESDAAALEKEPKIEKTELGKETIDGHACVKSKVVMTTGDGKSQEFTVWTATDLKDFPVQIQTDEKAGNLTMHYTNIVFAKPDAAQFEPPTDFTAYTDLQQMMMSAMQKMMGGMKPPQ